MADVEIKVKINGVEYTQAELKKLATASQDTATATDNMTASQEKASKQNKETGESFKRVQLQIRETQIALQKAAAAGDTVKFEQLRGQLDELEEGLEKTQFQAQQFDDQLSALPGPAGAAGNAIKSIDGLFKMLAANPVLAVITALVGIFLLLKKSMESTSEGQAVLNKITDAFGKILGPVMLIVQKVALPIFEALATVIEKVAGAFTFFAEKLGFSEKQIAEASKGIEKVQEETAKKEEDLKKKIEERMLKEQEAAKKAEEARKKQAEAAKKRLEDQKAIEKTLEGLRVAALKDEAEKLTEEVRLQKEAALEEFKAKGASKEQIAQLEGFYDQLAIEKLKAFNDAKAAEQKKADEEAEKAADEAAKAAEEKRLAAEQKELERLARLNEIDFMNYQASLETDAQRQLAAIDREEQLAMQELENLKASEQQKTETLEYYADLRQQVRVQEAQNALAATAEILGNISQLAGEGTTVAKGAAVAQATINTYLGATQMLADPTIPSFLKPFLLISQLALGFKQVKEINKVEPPKAAYGGMINGPSHSNGGTLIEAEGGEFILNKYAMQQPGVAQIANALNQVATPDRPGGSGMAPIKTYVVATDVTTAQEANQKVERLAKL